MAEKLVFWPSNTVTLVLGWRDQLILVPGQVMTAMLLLAAVIREAEPSAGRPESRASSAMV